MKSQNHHSACPISGSRCLDPIEEYADYHLVKSKPLGFVFSRSIPTDIELAEHYSGYDRARVLSPITIKRYRELLTSFEPYRKTNRLFDIGCGRGDFLQVAKEMGWEVHGNEFTQDALDACSAKGVEVKLGAPDKAWYTEREFDVVTSFEVIEHLSYPVEHVQFAHHLLRSQGLFYCTTPNFNSLERRMTGKDYEVICYPEHLSYFTKNTLDHIMTENGFFKKNLVTTGISPAKVKRALGGRKSSKSETEAPKNDDKLRNDLENKAGLQIVKSVLNGLLDISSLGSALKAHYLKV